MPDNGAPPFCMSTVNPTSGPPISTVVDCNSARVKRGDPQTIVTDAV
jgi:hypothetical protein